MVLGLKGSGLTRFWRQIVSEQDSTAEPSQVETRQARERGSVRISKRERGGIPV